MEEKQEAHGPHRSPDKPVQIKKPHLRKPMKYIITIGPVVMKMWKVYRQTDRWTDRRTTDRRSEKLI